MSPNNRLTDLMDENLSRVLDSHDRLSKLIILHNEMIVQVLTAMKDYTALINNETIPESQKYTLTNSYITNQQILKENLERIDEHLNLNTIGLMKEIEHIIYTHNHEISVSDILDSRPTSNRTESIILSFKNSLKAPSPSGA